jgi:hypothetical protein
MTDDDYKFHKSISVGDRLVGSLNIDGDVISLVLAQLGKLSTEGAKMETGNLLVELLGENVDLALLVLLGILVDPEIDLSDDLVGEGSRHHKRGVAGGTAQVEKTTLSQDEDTMAIGELPAVELRLDVLSLDAGV